MKIIVAESAEDVPMQIQSELLEQGRSQVLLARELGFTEKHVSQILTGKSNVTVANLYKILAYLDLALVLSPHQEGVRGGCGPPLLVGKLRDKARAVELSRRAKDGGMSEQEASK